jgi:hypothetical protein
MAFNFRIEDCPLRMNESERMSTQPVAPAKRVQAKQTITKNDDAKFVSIVRTDTWTPGPWTGQNR